MKKLVFKAWESRYRKWKVKKNEEDFQLRLKKEMQTIAAQFNKEIDDLRSNLDQANVVIDRDQKTKAMMQENLKKAFMKGVCAMNMEAMTILHPGEGGQVNSWQSEATPIRQPVFPSPYPADMNKTELVSNSDADGSYHITDEM